MQILNKLASPFLYLGGRYQSHWRQRANQETITVVLMYHRVVADGEAGDASFGIERGIAASVFEAQLKFMLKHFTAVAPSQVQSHSTSPLRFAVTLDDGYEDNYHVAAPILRRLEIPAAFYVVSDFVGTERLFWWEQLAQLIRETQLTSLELSEAVPELLSSTPLPPSLPLKTKVERYNAYERLSAVMRAGPHVGLAHQLAKLSSVLGVTPRLEGRAYGLMNWDQLRELNRQGFEIGGHTATHCNVVGADDELLRTEVIESTFTIERQLGSPVLTFAYPYGNFLKSDERVIAALQQTGCQAAFTVANGVVSANQSKFELPRTRLNRQYGFACAYNIQDALFARPVGGSSY